MTELEKRIAAAREKISAGEEVKTTGEELSQRIAQAREKIAAAPAAEPSTAAVTATPKVTMERNLIQTRDDAGVLPAKTGSLSQRINALREDDGRVDVADRADLLSVVPGKTLSNPVNEEAAAARRAEQEAAAKTGRDSVLNLYQGNAMWRDGQRVGGSAMRMETPEQLDSRLWSGTLRNTSDGDLGQMAEEGRDRLKSLRRDLTNAQYDLQIAQDLMDDVGAAEAEARIAKLEREIEPLTGRVRDMESESRSRKDEAYHTERRGNIADLEQAARSAADFEAVVEAERAYLNDVQLRQMYGDRTKEQMDVMLYLAGTDQQEKLDEYWDALQWDVNAAETQKMLEAVEGRSVLGNVAANIGASYLAPGAWIATLVHEAKNAITGEYTPLDTNTNWFAGAQLAEATAEAVSKKAEMGVDIAGKDMGSFLAETGLSLAQFLSKVPLGPAALAYMGASAAGQTTYEALESGHSSGQALALGTAAGLIEAATEKIGLDSLMDIAMGAGAKGVKAVLKQAFSEAGEEAISQVANTLAEAVILNENSEFSRYVEQLVRSGMSRGDAQVQAVKQFLVANTLWAAAGGALSGGISGTGGAVVGSVGQNKTASGGEAGVGLVKDGNYRKMNLSSRDSRTLDAIGRAAGVSVRFAPEVTVGGKKANAKYESGVITIAQNAQDPVRVAFTHEIVHRIKEASPEAYASLEGFVRNGMRSSSLEVLGGLYSEVYETESPDVYTEEIVADAFGAMLGDRAVLEQFVRDDRNAAQKMLDAVRDFIAAIRRALNGQNKTLSMDERRAFAELETDLAGMERALTSALNAIAGNKNAAPTSGTAKASYAGVKSRTANLVALQEAEQMEAIGTDTESIRWETGWFRGADGQWRYEIDDSGMEFRKDGDARLMKEDGYKRLQGLTDKWAQSFDGGEALTAEEEVELEQLQEEYSDRVWEEKYMLTDFVKHDTLFEAYPRLKGVSLIFDDLSGGTKGFFSKRSNTIVLSNELFGKEADVVLHEIQHVIQKIEGFSGGASPEYWRGRMADGYSKRTSTGLEMMPSDLYENTAGEIEARDTARRRTMTAEERRMKRPDIGDEDTVFAEGAAVGYSTQAEVLALPDVDWMGDFTSIKDQLSAHLDEINEMQPVAVVDYAPKSAPKLVAMIMDEVAKIGGKNMKNGGVGFAFDKEGAEKIDAHAKKVELRAAALAAPYVAKYGRLIAGQKNHENTGLTTLTYAAPAIINGTTVNVGVAIQFQSNGRPRAVNVGLQIGDAFKIDMKKAPKGPDSRISRYGQGTALPTMDAFEETIAQSGQKSNTKSSLQISPERWADAADRIEAESGTGAMEIDPVTMLPNIQKPAENVSNLDTGDVGPVSGLPMFKRVTPLEKTPEQIEAEYAALEREAIQTEGAAETQQTAGNAAQAQQSAEVAEEGGGLDRIKALYKDQKAAKRNYERIRARAAQAVFDKEIDTWNAARREELKTRARQLLATSVTWKDKPAGLLYSRETMERNVEDIVPDKALADEVNREYFRVEKTDSANVNRTVNHYRDRVRKLDLSRKAAKGETMSESAAVQLLGEAEFNIKDIKDSRGRRTEKYGKTAQEWEAEIAKMWEKNPSLKAKEAKIRAAVEEFRKIYDELYQQMNDAHIRNGYSPVGYIEGYFPHFQADATDSILAKLGLGVGINVDTATLPTSINGLTHTFKPGKQWFAHAQQRTGVDTTYDALEGFERYISVAANVIHRTDTIQKQRALAREIRYQGSDETTRRRIREIERSDRTEDAKETDIKEVTKGRYALSNFVVELEEHTNLYAGKKSRHDRMSETDLGRRIYRIMGKVKQRTGANMVGANLSSAITNFIPLTNANAELGPRYIAKGMWDTLKNIKEKDVLDDQSTFIVNRRGSKPVYQTFSEKASDVASIPMEAVDMFTSGSLVRARYLYNLDHGMGHADALDDADSWTGRVIGDRSKGAMPTLFERRSPWWGMLTQFQLEVNNEFSHLLKDVPRDLKDKSLAQIAAYLFLFAVGRYVFNDFYEKAVGRRPAFDPLGILNDTVGDFTGYEMPNLLELRSGFEVEKQKPMKALGNLGTNVLEELPFTSVLSMVGLDIDGGRLPATSALPDLTNMGSLPNAGKELAKPLTYLAPPFGGGQAKKVIEGVKAVAKGGSYKKDAEGNDKLQYPVFADSALETAGVLGKAVLFGKSSLGTAQDWVEGGFKTWDAGYTAAYQNMRKAGMDDRTAYEILSAMKAAEKPAEKLGVLAEQELPDKMTQELAGLVMGTELESEEGNKTAYAKLLDAKEELGLTAAEYLAYYEKYGGQVMGEDKLRTAYEKGVDVEDYLEYYSGRKEYDADKSGSLSTKETIAAIEGSGLTGTARVGMYLLEFPEWGEKATEYQVGINVFIDYKIATTGLKGKEKIVKAINRMRVSKGTKDKLYLAAGYAEKTLEEAPWN